VTEAHAHLAMNLFRGEADDVSLEEFLERLSLTTIDERSVLDRITGLRRARAVGEERT
jgi:cytosine/adenosine deaminase-related metal-dependent hydrolase